MKLRDKIKGRGLFGMAVGMMMAQCTLFSLTACSDTWEEHYDDPQKRGTQSLMTIIDADPQLSNFGKLLRATHIYTNNRRSNVTYADMLGADQSLTVWAPINGTYNADSLLALCQTAKGDSGVAVHFVTNHIARSLHSLSGTELNSVRMLNGKYVTIAEDYVGGRTPVSINNHAKNGVLHKLDGDAYYYYNIYDAITSLDEYAHFGAPLLQFERQELDEEASVVADIVNGEKIYSDSVTYKQNTFFNYIDDVYSEDSMYMVLAPSKEVWEPVYNEAKKYFNYGNVAKADSLTAFWTSVNLLQDLFYNYNLQYSMRDSIMSTGYYRNGWPYHVFYDPYGEDGIITRSEPKSFRDCSNGYIYNITKWPFTIKEQFFHPITIQAEQSYYMTNSTDCTYSENEAFGDTISGNKYLYIKAKSNKNWTISFNVPQTLSGTYDVCAVVLPKTVYRATSKDVRPNKLFATLEYKDVDGKKQILEFEDPAISTGLTVDTIRFGRITMPVCNYGQKEADLNVTIKCTLARTETAYSRECLLDCIYLRPVTEEDMKNEEEANQNGVKPRKEAKK